MMYTLYNPGTGRITGHTNDPNRARNEPSVEGLYPEDVFYVERGRPQRYPTRPTGAFWHTYTWNSHVKQWVLDIESTIKQAQAYRSKLLSYVDKINPVWWDSMTPDQQRVIQIFRKSLLDITEQKGYPEQIEWPSIPGFLRN